MLQKQIVIVLSFLFIFSFLFDCCNIADPGNDPYIFDESAESSSEISASSSESSSSVSSVFSGAISGSWTWVSGNKDFEYIGVYGTIGIPDTENFPGPRNSSVNWTDGSGGLWLFGGWGNDSMGFNQGYLNDLWKFDGVSWTWISGSNIMDQNGNYGIKGTPDSNNVPGGRYNAVSWQDKSGNFWLFGGTGLNDDMTYYSGLLNDLWKYDGTNWTWVSGTNLKDQAGIYGCKGVPDRNNIPGGRTFSTGWTDSSGNLWLFGGTTTDIYYDTERRNDLWKFDGTNWTWISGSREKNQSGIYGTKGIADSGNIPGARECPVSWYDRSGNAWIFGGYGYDKSGGFGCLNDLWKFDGTNWTWVSGSDTANQSGNYGIKGSTDRANMPGSRGCCSGWIDKQNNLWLFGGTGNDYTGYYGYLNDLWKFNGKEWVWISGSNAINQGGIYGEIGIHDANNTPGTRYQCMNWFDRFGNLWLFGGYGYNSSPYFDQHLNDLWKYTP